MIGILALKKTIGYSIYNSIITQKDLLIIACGTVKMDPQVRTNSVDKSIKPKLSLNKNDH